MKRNVLLAICENPGWQPPQPVASQMEVALSQLQAEGWIQSRLDGWEATPRALEAYPKFWEEEELAAPLERDEQGRPRHVIGEPEPDWATITLPTLSIADFQRVEAAIEHPGLKGGVTLTNMSKAPNRVEVAITVRVREVPR